MSQSELKPKPTREQKLEAALVDLLRAPYMEWQSMAITNACILTGHPDRWPEGQRPKFKIGGCVCGTRRKEDSLAWVP